MNKSPFSSAAVGGLLRAAFCSAVWQACAAQAAPSLEGLWRFDDDGTVIEFARCGDASCATVRQPPPKSEHPADDPKCVQTLIGSMKPDGTNGHHSGWAADPADNKRYSARLEPDGEQRLRLVVRALGGLINETFKLQAVQGAVEPCAR